MTRVMQFISDERGIQHAEEGLLLALIAVALTAAATTLKGGIENVFTTANTKMATS